MLCLPLSKSSWIEGRIGPEAYQDCHRIVKISIDLLNKNKVNKILLLSDFKSKQSSKSELEYITEICKKYNIKIFVKKIKAEFAFFFPPLLFISSCHLFLHHHLGLKPHNGVNLSYRLGTSVT